MSQRRIHKCIGEGCTTLIERRGARCRPCYNAELEKKRRRCSTGCGAIVSQGDVSDRRCRACYDAGRPARPRRAKNWQYPTGPCAGEGCDAQIRMVPRRKTRLCKRCSPREVARDPARIAKLRAVLRAKVESDPAWLASLKARMDRIHTDPDIVARHRAATQATARAMLAWCPDAYLASYKALQAKPSISAAEAKAMVLDQIEADRRRVSSGALVDQETFIAVRQAAAWARERGEA